MRLNADHYEAISYLAQPGHGGLTMEEIADKASVSVRTLYNWRKNTTFEKELKKTMIRHTQHKLPEVMDAMIESATKDRNAAMVKLILQMNDMLPTSTEDMDTKLGSKVSGTDLQAMQDRINKYKKSRNVVDISSR